MDEGEIRGGPRRCCDMAVDGAKEAQAEGGRGDPRCGWTNIICVVCEASLRGSFSLRNHKSINSYDNFLDRRTDRRSQDLRTKKVEFQFGTHVRTLFARYDICQLEPSDEQTVRANMRSANSGQKKIYNHSTVAWRTLLTSYVLLDEKNFPNRNY